MRIKVYHSSVQCGTVHCVHHGSQGLGTAYLLRLVPKTKQLRNLESMFTVPEWFAQLLGEATIDLPAARSALEKI